MAKEEHGCCARQVLAQRPALLFLGGPPEDVQFALDRHNATLPGALRTNFCRASALLCPAVDIWFCRLPVRRDMQLSWLGLARRF